MRGAEIEGMLDEQGKVIEEGMYSCNMKLIALQESDFRFGKADTLLSLRHSISFLAGYNLRLFFYNLYSYDVNLPRSVHRL